MVAAVDFIDEQEDRFAFGDFFVDFAEFMVDGVNRRARFDCRQAADFPFFEEVAVDADEAPVVLGSQFPGQGSLADTRFADEQWDFAGFED